MLLLLSTLPHNVIHFIMKKCSIFFLTLFLTTISLCQEKVTTGILNLRTSPEIGNNKICIVPRGCSVSILPDSIKSEDWIRVNYDGHIGYVYKQYLKNPSEKSSTVSNISSGKKYYTNSKGEKVQSPTRYNSPPPGATAECNDGTYSFSHSRRGTCSHHGGVKRWL